MLSKATIFDYHHALELQKKASPHTEYSKLIKNRSVCIVAGAPSIDRGFVEKSAFIIRVNKHFGRVRDIPTNAIYWNNTKLTPELKKVLKEIRGKGELKFVWINIPAGEYQEMAEFCCEYGIPWSFWGCDEVMRNTPGFEEMMWVDQMMRDYTISPLTGMSAVEHILQLGAKRLFLTGMDFYRSCTSNNLPPQWIAMHEVLPQILYLEEKWKSDDRIILDATLIEMIDKRCHYCGHIHKMGIIPNPGDMKVLYPGERVELWTEGKVLKTLLEFKHANPTFFDKVVGFVDGIKEGKFALTEKMEPVSLAR